MNLFDLQYLVSGVLSLLVSVYVMVKRPRTTALRSLGLFGTIVTLWEAANFFGGIAPDLATATLFFKISLITSHLCFPLYLYTVLNIQEKRSRKIIIPVFAPVTIQAAIWTQKYFDNYVFFRTESRWVYNVVSFGLPLIINSVIFLGYLACIILVLLRLTIGTSFPFLKKKYSILLFSFTLFQAVGTTLVNALIAFNLLDVNLVFGGILQFLTFVSIWYALSLKEKAISQPVGERFSEIYSSFLTVYYNSVASSKLGEEIFRFKGFIKASGIENQVSLGKEKITFTEARDFDLVKLIDKNLKILDGDNVPDEVIDKYLRVLNTASQILGHRFYGVIKSNEEFLKKSDLIYGISRGRFLEVISEDESLKDLDDADTCLRIYRRILLPYMNQAQANVEFQKKLSQYHIAEMMEISDYGEVSIRTSRYWLSGVPKDQRVMFIIERFNPFLSWVFEELLMNTDIGEGETIGKLKIVLKLNKEKAVALGIYPTLLGRLATKIPRTQIYRLYSDYLEELVEERTRELKEANENLLKSQRLAVIGEAAAMVGHDLRNPLQVIVNTLYLARRMLVLSPNPDLETVVKTIGEQVEYMNKIVSDLQDYARPIRPKLVQTNLRQLLEETLLTISIPEAVEASIEVEKNLLTFIGDPLLLKRVFTNLTINALQAMPKGGRLTVKAFRKGETLHVSFQDTGVGISKEYMPKLFQPLFTTKAKGQGLGLAVCKRLIEAINGSITVESEIGKGTTFTIEIPFLAHMPEAQPLITAEILPVHPQKT